MPQSGSGGLLGLSHVSSSDFMEKKMGNDHLFITMAQCKLLSERFSMDFPGLLKNGCSFEDDLSLGAEGKFSSFSHFLIYVIALKCAAL